MRIPINLTIDMDQQGNILEVYIPCIRVTDGAVGMFRDISNKFMPIEEYLELRCCNDNRKTNGTAKEL